MDERAEQRCVACGYDLSGQFGAGGAGDERRCPECGARFVWQPVPVRAPAASDSPVAEGTQVQSERMSATSRRLRRVERWVLILMFIGALFVPLALWIVMVILDAS